MASSAVFKLAQRPSHTVSNKKGEEFELKSGVKGALLFLKDCTDCHASLSEKAAKILVEDCNNLVLDVKSPLLSGTLELVSCKNVVLNLLEGVQIPTLMADSTTELTINVLQHLQFESLYIHQSSDIEVCILRDNPVKHKVFFPPDAPLDFQFLVHWEKQGDTQEIICEKVVREGVFPTTERKLKGDTERRHRNMQKLAETLADAIQIGPRKSPKSTEKGTTSGTDGGSDKK